jgi:hypothetical protein
LKKLTSRIVVKSLSYFNSGICIEQAAQKEPRTNQIGSITTTAIVVSELHD